MSTSEIKVAIIDDQREIREGLGMLIDNTEGYRCTGTFRSMGEALDGLPEHLPGISGIEGIRILKERFPGCTF